MKHLYCTDKLFSPSLSFEDAHNTLDLSRLILEGNREKYANYRLRPLKTKALRALLSSADAMRLPYLGVSAEVESHVTRDYFPSAA